MEQHAGPNATTDQEIDRSRLAFEAALRRGDASAAASIYTDDATLLAPAADVMHGRAAIERFWQTGVDTGIEALDLAVLVVRRQGDVALEIGNYVIRLAPGDGSIVFDRGRYLIVHRCGTDGQWRRAAEMFSPDVPRTPVRV